MYDWYNNINPQRVEDKTLRVLAIKKDDVGFNIILYKLPFSNTSGSVNDANYKGPL